MSTLKVDNIRHNSATSDAITMASDGTCTAKLTSINGGQLSHHNIIINGAMTVAQRGTSSTSSLYQTVDRMAIVIGGTDENPTQAQVDVASGTTPYSLGFRKAFKVTNGNQTGGLGTTDIIEALRYRVEAQDIANSGWNYTDSNSFITLSFWVKSSVSFNMKGYFFTQDNTYNYPLETGTLSANTWTKIIRTIPGNSNLVFNNDNGHGLTISWGVYGTNYSSGNPAVNQWVDYSAATLTNPSETTWYTTNDATLEFTGLQLEVGDTATTFEHLSFAENKRRCYRYCQRGRHATYCLVGATSTYYFSRANIPLFTPMRASVTGTLKQATWNSNRYFKYSTWSSDTYLTTAPASATFNSGNITDASSDIISVQLHVNVSSGASNTPLPANGPGSNNVYPIEYFDVLLEAEL